MNAASKFSLFSTTALAILSSPAIAQTESAPSSEQVAENAGGISDIVVTAQKRSENVQDVPIAISAFSAESLTARGTTKGEDLQFNVPGLYIASASAGPSTVVIRGVGGSADRTAVPGLNPAVPVHVNGVYLQSSSPLLQDFLDIERVEVVRGPQGTLYGRNAVGGSINIVTNQPTDTLEGEVGAEVGNYDHRRVHGVLSGPITNGIRGRVAFAVAKHDPYAENLYDSSYDRQLSADYHNFRAALQFDVASNVMATVTGYDYKNTGSNYVLRPRVLPAFDPTGVSVYNYVPAGYVPASAGSLKKISQDTPTNGVDKLRGITGQIVADFGNVSVKSISGYFDTKTGNVTDGDGLDLPQTRIVINSFQQYRGISQEFQFASSGEGPLKWLLGLYYYDERSKSFLLFDASQSASAFPVRVDFASNPSKVHSRSMAAFGQVDLNVTDQLVMTAGLRYTYDKVDVNRSGAIYSGNTLLFSWADVLDKDSWKKPTWKLGANYHVDDDVMFYASYSRGYRAGGFNLQDTNASFDPERLDAYEIGIKSQWLDRRLQINASTFYYDYSDKQEIVQDSQGFNMIVNAAAATVKGGELEMIVQPIDQIQLDASASYLDATYDTFQTFDPERPDITDPNLGDVVTDQFYLDGKRLTNAPKWQLHFGGQVEQELGDSGQITLRVDHTWLGSNFVRPFNTPTDRIASHHRTNASLTWQSANGQWMAQLYVKNLSGKITPSSFVATGPQNLFDHQTSYLDPRTYGLKLKYQF